MLVQNTDDGWISLLQKLPLKRIFAQGCQDGIIEFIFQNIGVKNKFCVEFGFNAAVLTGGSGANTANLILNNGWTGLMLDGDNENLDINLHKEMLSMENIGGVFKKYSVPQEPDYVSIDVDSVDLWLFKGMLLSGYRPRLVSVEYNINFPITESVTVKQGTVYSPADGAYGASLLALNTVAEEFDYSLVCVDRCYDAFFVRGDLAPRTAVSSFTAAVGAQMHAVPSKQRIASFVEYPSLDPIKNIPPYWQ